MPRNAKAAKRTVKSIDDQMKKPRPNAEKVCSFWELPRHLRIPLLKKFDAVSLMRMRRTNNHVNLLVEKETSLRARSEHKLVIKIELNLEKYLVSFLTTQGKFCDMNQLDYFDAIHDYNTCNFTKIKNPQKQLGGVHFKYILVDFIRPNEESERGFWRHFERRVVPILKELRFHCDALVFNNTEKCDVSPVFPLIRFSTLKFQSCKIDPRKMNWNIEDGNVLIIKELDSQDITPAFGAFVQFEEVILSVYFHDTGVKEITKAIHEMPLGKLKRLELIDAWTLFDSSGEEEEGDFEERVGEENDDLDDPIGLEDDDEPEEEMGGALIEGEEEDEGEDLHDPRNIGLLPMVQTLRSTDSKGRPADDIFYKMALKHGGYAIISRGRYDSSDDTFDFNFFIFPEYSRENLFEACYRSYSLEREKAFSFPLRREFFEAETDEEAINLACENDWY